MRGLITSIFIASGLILFSATVASAQDQIKVDHAVNMDLAGPAQLSRSRRRLRASAIAQMRSAIDRCDYQAYQKATEDLGANDIAAYPHADCSLAFTLSVGGRIGTVDRPSAMFLRTELGGNIISPYFLNIDRGNTDFTGFDIRDVKYAWIDPFGFFTNDELDNMFFGLYFGYSYASSSLNYTALQLSAGGNQVGVLSPAGPGAPLGGGVVTAAGFGDVTNIVFSDFYDEQFFRTGIQRTLNLGANISWTPRVGYAYSYVEEKSALSAMTNAGTFSIRYDNHSETDRHILELGSEVRVNIANNFGVFVDGDLRFINNNAHGYSKLRAGNFAPEIGRFSRSEGDVGGRIGAGVFVENEFVQGRAGVEYETWQIPSVHIPGTSPAYLTFEDRDSVTGRFDFTFKFPPF